MFFRPEDLYCGRVPHAPLSAHQSDSYDDSMYSQHIKRRNSPRSQHVHGHKDQRRYTSPEGLQQYMYNEDEILGKTRNYQNNNSLTQRYGNKYNIYTLEQEVTTPHFSIVG